MKEIDALVEAMQKALSEDKDIADLVADFTEISGSFGKQTKSGIHGSSGLAKAFKGGNKVSNIPEGLEAYKSYIQHPDNYKWVRWQLDGRNFSDISHDCPFCTNDIKEKKETIKRVGEVYEPKAIENLNKIVSAFQRLNKYFSDETRKQIEEFVTNVNGYSDDQVAFLKEIKDQIDRLNHKFINAQRLGFSSLKDVEKVIVGLKDHRIDLGLFVHLKSESTQIKADIVNQAIDRLLEQAGVLQGSINRQKILIERLVKENSKNINEFLKNAGYQYSVCLTEEGNGQHKLKLTHNDIGQEISNAKGHLSFGERNAFALVLFMFDVIKSAPDLIVLDDPISSFDKNKKYAIVEMLFRKESSLRNKTVLMLTHDFEPIVDMVMHHSDRFQKPFATFLENKKGVLEEKQISKSDIKTFVEIIDANLSIEMPHINKLTYLRRRSEISGKRDMAYHLISNIFHKRAVPTIPDEETLTRPMTPEEIQLGTELIAEYIPGFEYSNMLTIVTDDNTMKQLYENSTNDYEKLHIYRIVSDGRADNIESDVIQKFINEAFHIENDYIYQLSPRDYQLVPQFVIDECDRYIESLQ
jgi:ABC-type phosphate/phosphonate transport system ATPase subunit